MLFIRWFACSEAEVEVVAGAETPAVVLLLLGLLLSSAGVVVAVVVVVVAGFEVELAVFGAAARAPGDDTDDDDDDEVVGLDCAGLTRVLMLLLLMHLPNALLLLILLLFVLELFKFFADDVAAANRDEWGSVPTFVDPIGPLAVDEIRVSYNSFISLMLLLGSPPPLPLPSTETLSRRFFSAGHSSNPLGLCGADRLCCCCCCCDSSLFRSSSLFDFTLGLPPAVGANAPAV